MSRSPGLVVVGAGGHARPVVDCALALGYRVECVIDVHAAVSTAGEKILGVPVRGGIESLGGYPPGEAAVFVAVGDNRARSKLLSDVESRGYELPVLRHPSAVVSPFVQVGPGTLINAGAVVNAEVRVGRGAILNTGCVVDHQAEIGDYAHVGPGASLAGRTRIGTGSFVGIGATVLDRRRIGAWAVIGAGAVVTRDIADGVVAVGVPARPRGSS